MRLIRSGPARWAVPALAAVLGLTLVAAPVQAAGDRPTQASVKDHRHDVRRVVDRNGHESRPRVDRRRRAGDVKAVDILHRSDVVTVRIRMRRLGHLEVGLLVMFRSKAARISAIYAPGFVPGTPVLLSNDRSGDDVDCPGAAANLRRARGAIQLDIPRTCLGNPSWVRARVISLSFAESRHRSVTYVDIAPGTRLRLKGNLSTRAWAPAGGVVDDVVPPPSDDRAVPHEQQRARDLVRRIEMLG